MYVYMYICIYVYGYMYVCIVRCKPLYCETYVTSTPINDVSLITTCLQLSCLLEEENKRI